MEEVPVRVLVAAAGFVAGIVFGATAQRTNFCTMGALSDIVFMGNYNRFRAWILAIAVAIVVSQGMDAAGLVELDESIYRTANFGWLPAIVRQADVRLQDDARRRLRQQRCWCAQAAENEVDRGDGVPQRLRLHGAARCNPGTPARTAEDAANIDLGDYGYETQGYRRITRPLLPWTPA
ncbi:MAG: YeeE/YedE family protein [Brucellaceae bacterium]|nr:YeeE/YedE family protein [Brucellaceae bacterium]